MIPVETPSPWWRVALDLLDHWQTLSAGAFALVAAIITLLVTWRAERRHARREWKPSGPSFDSKSTEHSTSMRPRRPVSHVRRADQRKDGGEQVTNARSDHLFSDAGKIGLLQGDAMGVVIIYTTPEGGRSRTDRLATAYNTPDDMSPDVVMETADVFLAACGHAQVVLPRLRTGDASYEDQDEALLQKIKAALAAGQLDRMIRIAISVEAFEAIAQTLPRGSVGYDERGKRLIWLEDAVAHPLFPPSATVLCSARRG